MIRKGGIPAHGPMATRNMFLLKSVLQVDKEYPGTSVERLRNIQALVTFVGVWLNSSILNVALLCHLGMNVSLTVILRHFLIFGDWNSS